jgi:hypothetical protein
VAEAVTTKSSPEKNGRQAERSSKDFTLQAEGPGVDGRLLTLQRAVGNRVVSQFLQSAFESTVPFVSGREGRPSPSEEGGTVDSNKKASHPLESNIKQTSNRSNDVPPIVRSVLEQGNGRPLDRSSRTLMESSFGQDFSRVRIHSDSRARQSAEAINAAAYTVGTNVVLGKPNYAFDTADGKALLAHELAHVVQQRPGQFNTATPLTIGSANHFLECEADHAAEKLREVPAINNQRFPEARENVSAPFLRQGLSISRIPSNVIQRQDKGKPKPAKAAEKKPAVVLTFGQVVFDQQARNALLKGGALLPGDDATHIGLGDDGRLGYDASYGEPTDPFRWEKVKFLIDSGEKILIRKVSLGDIVTVRFITKDKSEDRPIMLKDPGLTLPIESLQRRIYPTKPEVTASPSSDTHHIFFTTDITDAARSSLAHELLGHMWLALKGVPFVHPKQQPEIALRGTLEEKHKITDPFGNIYTEPVREFIDRYIGAEQFSVLKSPTQFVGRRLLERALVKLKSEFSAKAKGKLNGEFEIPDDIALIWETISINYEIAETADPKLQKSTEEDLTKWYSTLDVDKQYVFIRFIDALRYKIDRKTKLASELYSNLKPPAEMRRQE